MVKRIVGSELVGLVFVDSSACSTLPEQTRRAGKLVVNQSQTRITLHGIAPNRNGFLPAPELPERFALLLARENQIISFGQRFIQTRTRFFVTAQTIQDRAAIIEAQSFALVFLVSCGRVRAFVRIAQRRLTNIQTKPASAELRCLQTTPSSKPYQIMLFSLKNVFRDPPG